MRAVDDAPEPGGFNSWEVDVYYQDFETLFLNTCQQELTRVNDFFIYKQAEARRKLTTLNYQLTRGSATQATGSATSRNRQEEDNPKPPTARKLRLAMREFYLR